jgi:hypothetical protein
MSVYVAVLALFKSSPFFCYEFVMKLYIVVAFYLSNIHDPSPTCENISFNIYF